MPPVPMAAPIAAPSSRNAPCPCGSGEKYRRCCGAAAPSAAAPPAAAALLARGIASLRAGQAASAVPALHAAIEAGEQSAMAYHAFGTALLQTGRAAEACAILAHAAALQPDSADLHWDLGAAFDHRDMHEQAIAAYARAVALHPRLAPVHRRLGQLYALYGRNEDAARSLDAAADAQPQSPETRLCRADAAMLRGDLIAAERWARQAAALAPGNAAAQSGLAGILFNQGRFAEAEAAFEAALRAQPDLGKAWLGLAQCRRHSDPAAAPLARMAEIARKPGLPAAERMLIHFAAGKMREDGGDYAHAMAEFDAANALRAQGLPFDRASLQRDVDRAIATFTPEFFARHAPLGSIDERPVFIVGMVRSGTTLVEQILSSHPRIAAAGELTLWGPRDLEPDAAGLLPPARAAAAAEAYLSGLARIAPGAARITDKLPANLFRLGAIHALFPRARIIHCARDAADTALSIYTTHFGTPLPFAARREDLAFYAWQNTRMMAHWRAVLPPHCLLDISYESLIKAPEAQIRRLVAFTGLDWDAACLAPERNTRPIATASAWQARQPVYASSVARWRRFRGWGESWAQAWRAATGQSAAPG